MRGLIDISPKKSQKVKLANKPNRQRLFSYKYFIKKNNDRIQVCQKCFKNIFNETDQFLKTVSKKIMKPGTLLDERERKKCSFKLSEEQEKLVLNHIRSFPAYEGHYTRRDSSKKYLQSDLNLSIMYRLNCELQANPVSITTYKKFLRH